jgi:hypothetical protein
MVLHNYVSHGEWTIGLLVATVQRRGFTRLKLSSSSSATVKLFRFFHSTVRHRCQWWVYLCNKYDKILVLASSQTHTVLQRKGLLKRETVCSTETLASVYKSARRYNVEGQDRHLRLCDNLRSHYVQFCNVLLLSLQRFVCLNHKACFGACNKVNESLLTKCRVPHNVNDSALFASIYFYSFHVCDVLICRKVKYPLAPVGWRREELN